MLLPIADKDRLTALLSAKGIRSAPDAEFKVLPWCRVYYLHWQGDGGPYEACMFTSRHLPVLLCNGCNIPVSIEDLAAFGMIEEKEDDT